MSENILFMSLLPLQVPGGVEVPIILLDILVVSGVIGRWVYQDTKSRGSD